VADNLQENCQLLLFVKTNTYNKHRMPELARIARRSASGGAAQHRHEGHVA
jgi:hypothetical protein